MDKKAAVAALLPALALYACDRAVAPPKPGEAAAASPMAAPPAASRDEGHAPPVLIPEAERGVTGARDVLLTFARAIEHRQFDQAWAMLSTQDRRTWSKEGFRNQFDGLGDITVAAPSGRMETKAGAAYYTAPLAITANDASGRPIRYEGDAVLRRGNGVEDAASSPLRWQFERLTLDWTH